MKISRIICRTLVGLLFMFSGFVKSVDPLGFTYKLQEYFIAYHFTWLSSFATLLAIILFIIEFAIGAMLVFGVKPKLTSWLAFVMMFFFTGFTLLSAINNPVSDCGCFGDAIKLTNWESFFKSIILLILAIFLVLTSKHSIPAFSKRTEYVVIILSAGIILFTSIYSLRHLPLIDFLPWKVGSKISEQVISTPEIAESILKYRDKKTGQIYEYTSKTLPWQDSVKWASIEYDTTIKKVIQAFKEAPIHDFVIEDDDGNNLTDKIISNPGYQFILVAYDITKTNRDAFEAINKLVEGCDKDSISFVGLSGSVYETIEAFRHDVQAMFPIYNVDETALKTMIRSNPGLLLLKNGVVIAKWAWRDVLEYADVKEKYMNK
jgi:uncharacterized membrane protein YphA (DoxX/SURF4 family)